MPESTIVLPSGAPVFFNSSATYALRALALLATRDDATPFLGRDVAARVRVPPPYLAKIMSTLARAGLVRATRGVSGGYRLARPADDIHLIEIVEPFEGTRIRVGCLLDPQKPCSDADACSIHAAWANARSAYVSFLEATTLAEIKARPLPPGRGRRARAAPARPVRS